MRIERVHEASPGITAWTVAGYASPVSDLAWHITMTGATPGPLVGTVLDAVVSGTVETEGTFLSADTAEPLTRPLGESGWQFTGGGHYLTWKAPGADIHLTFNALAAQFPSAMATPWMIWAGPRFNRRQVKWLIETPSGTPTHLLTDVITELAEGTARPSHPTHLRSNTLHESTTTPIAPAAVPASTPTRRFTP
ncbi:DUF317 domain-containing protein [Streptomyces sp. NPDC088789]|uniref:DUF317 domain-containing protein n=1 Tax=Streptomyces sp. NPDC088789 TaxID=3365899 RepID=UPI003800FBFD